MMHDDLNGDDGAADARIERQIKLVAELDQAGRYGEGRAARELLALMTEVRDQLRRARHLRIKRSEHGQTFARTSRRLPEKRGSIPPKRSRRRRAVAY